MIARGLKIALAMMLTAMAVAHAPRQAFAAPSADCDAINTTYSGGMTIVKPAGSNIFDSRSSFTPGEVIRYSVTSVSGTMKLSLSALTESIAAVTSGDLLVTSGNFRVQTVGTSGSISFSITCETGPPNADLSNLVISSGMSPAFSSAITSYTLSLPYSASTTKVRPTVFLPNSTVTVNGVSVTSGTFSGAIPLDVGPNTINTVVTAADGTTTKTYSVVVTRAPDPTNANLSALALTSGTLDPVFSSGTTSYTATVSNSVSSLQVSPTASAAAATIKVQGTVVSSGDTSSAIALDVGSNVISIEVTAANGTTKKTYSVTVTREGSNNADLANLSLSAGSLSPAFSSGQASYVATVASSVSSIALTPTTDDANATVTVDNVAVTSGVATAPIALNFGSNTIAVRVTAEDGTTSNTYTVEVTREASTDANLSALSISSGTLDPAFASGTTSYTVEVPNSAALVAITPTVADANSTVEVGGNAVTSGTASPMLSMSVGSNPVAVLVRAQDGTTTKTYTVDVVRAPSSTAVLGALSLSQGTLSPSFSGSTYSYSATVPNPVSSVTVTAGIGHYAASATVNGSMVTHGTPSTPVALSVGANTITVAVTAEDGTTTQNYTITLTRAAPGVIAFTPASGALPDGMAGETYAAGITTNANAANTPIFSISAGALPPGLILNVSTGEVSGTLAENALGDYSFTISAEDNAYFQGSASYTLKAVERSITVSDKSVDVQPGSTPPNVYLNNGATGGPFTSGEVVTVEPANAGTARIIQGELAQAGPTGPFGFYLKFTPNHGYSGAAKVGFKLISALGTSNMGVVTYNVSFDPMAVAAEIDGHVHSFVQARQNLVASNVKVPGLIERRRMGKARDAVTTLASPNGNGMMLGMSTSLAEMRAAQSGGLSAQQAFNVWVDGTLMAHKRDETDGDWGTFGMLSVGADYLLSPRALVGVSLHVDRMTDPTDEDAELKGTGWLAGPYASLEIGSGVFFDTSLLYGGSSNDIDTTFFDGSFDTTRWMWSAKISGEWSLDEVTTLTPRLRTVYLSEEVEDYGVGNATGDRLLLPGFTMEQFRVSVGADFERRYLAEDGLLLTPRIGATAGIASLDNSGVFGSVTAGLALSDGFNWDLDASVLFGFENDGELGIGGKLGGSLRF